MICEGLYNTAVVITIGAIKAAFDHLLRNSRVRFTPCAEYRDQWLRCLGFTTSDEVEAFNKINEPRVWVGHFLPHDWILKIGSDSNISFDRIQSTGKSRGKYPKRSDYKEMTPLPLASKAELVDTELIFFSVSYNQDHTHGAFMQFYGRNKNFPLAHIFELDHSTVNKKASILPHPVPEVMTEPRSTYHFNSLPARRLGEKEPFHESYIGTADLLIHLAKEMERHAKKFAGEINFERRDLKNSGLTLSIKGRCSLGSQCKCIGEGNSRFIHAHGVLFWKSAASITIASKEVSTPDVLLAVASQTTRGGLSGVEQVMSAMGLTHRSRNYTKRILHQHVWPWMQQHKTEARVAKLGALRGKTIYVSFDAGYNSSRHAQGATSTWICDGVILFVLTDTHTQAEKKEAAMLKRGLDMLEKAGIDVASLCIDQNERREPQGN